MEQHSRDRAAVRIPPPILFLACLAAGHVLDHLFPLSVVGCPWPWRMVPGGFLIAVSGFIAASAFRALGRNRTPFNPARPTVKIVREGTYRFSRNPLYLALILLLAGIAVLRTSAWLALAAVILFLLLDRLAVRPEERYLEEKFGRDYLDYKESVRRWI